MIKTFILDLLFPKYCVNCSQEGEWLCFECNQKVVPVVSQICPKCEKLSENGCYHKNCAKEKSLTGIICSAYFKEGPIREMIHNLKYNGVAELAGPLSELMAKALQDNFHFPIFNSQLVSNFHSKKLKTVNCELKTILTFVPMHWSRQAKRGYNQAEILARAVGAKTGIEVLEMLKKSKQTKRQAELSGNRRRKNLQGTFELKTSTNIKNRKIIIVDDVATTGATLNECAAVLKASGAKEVWGLVVSRG